MRYGRKSKLWKYLHHQSTQWRIKLNDKFVMFKVDSDFFFHCKVVNWYRMYVLQHFRSMWISWISKHYSCFFLPIKCLRILGIGEKEMCAFVVWLFVNRCLHTEELQFVHISCWLHNMHSMNIVDDLQAKHNFYQP